MKKKEQEKSLNIKLVNDKTLTGFPLGTIILDANQVKHEPEVFKFSAKMDISVDLKDYTVVLSAN